MSQHSTTRVRRAAIARRTALAGLALAGVCAPVSGQAVYDVSHTFTIRTPGNLAPQVRHDYIIDTNARTDRVRDNPARVKASHNIGAGAHVDTQTAGPVPSTAVANSRANITTLAPGVVSGTIQVDGSAAAILGRNSAFAFSAAYSNVRVRGRHLDRRGRILFEGRWRSTRPVVGGARSRRRIVRDPIIARLIDNTTGEVQEWTLMTTESQVLGGGFEWDNDELKIDAREACFKLEVPGVITTQAGEIHLCVENGVVTTSSATGMFAGTALPAVGAPTDFTVPLSNDVALDYDMGGDPNNDLVPEIDLDNAGDADDAKKAWDNGGITTALASGYDLSNVSVPQLPQVTLGVPMTPGIMHVADNFFVEPSSGGPAMLDMLDLPVVQLGGPDPMPLDAVFVRLWRGHPMGGGFPIAGDMHTNRLEEVRNLHTYRVAENEPLETNTRPIVEAEVDMSWAPPLEPGEYWLEITAMGPAGEVFTIPAVNRDGQEDALGFFAPANQWQPLMDQGSGQPLDLSWRLHFVDDSPRPCYADCDGNGGLDIFDFLCFQDAFVAGDPYADCDGNNTLDVFDFLCFQDAFVTGCP
jgi:hypothetical protein